MQYIPAIYKRLDPARLPCPGPARSASTFESGRASATAIVALMVFAPAMALADVQPETQTGGPPILPVPTFMETGLPNYTMPVGTSSVLPPAGPGTGTGTASPPGSSDALTTLDSRSWGALAASNATAMGVNPSAIAATCMLETGCQSIAALGGSTVSGAFQMTNGTYSADIKQALVQNPSLAGSIDTSLAGKMDPANQAIAAAQDLKNAALALQAAGISSPTVMDTRGYFNFGAAVGSDLARSPADRNMSDILSAYYTPAQIAQNGITPSTTVGQWRASVTAKIGSAATQVVLL